ncbi:hypothetical protein HOY82DRAFT_605158 [Tuber indicum]|nr:hypothetical protein HOY82DRAFT_605158 [Tuber indicum]
MAMNALQWYSIVLGALVALPTLTLLTHLLLSRLYSLAIIPIRRHLAYATAPPWLGRPHPLSRQEALAILFCMAANWLCVLIASNGPADIRNRTGYIATIHMFPLCLGSRVGPLTSLSYLSHRGQQIAHSWLGWITIINRLVRSIITQGVERRLELDPVGISGLAAGIAMLAIILSSPLLSYSRTYETTVNAHILLGAWILGSLWYHLYALPSRLGLLYLNIAIGVLLIGYVSRWAQIWFRSGGGGPEARRMGVRPLVDAIRVTIVVPRPWHFRAGQQVYLRVLGMGIRALWQSHLFTIAWWDRNRITLLIRPRGGFTRRLLLYADCKLHALVEGPFGVEHDLRSYAGVLIWAQRGRGGRSRHSGLMAAHQEWVKEWMDQLLKLDVNYSLSIYIYVTGGYADPLALPRAEEHFGEHDRVNRVFGDLDTALVLSGELSRRRDRTVVVACAGPPMIDNIRRTVRRALQQDVRLVELGAWACPSSNGAMASILSTGAG